MVAATPEPDWNDILDRAYQSYKADLDALSDYAVERFEEACDAGSEPYQVMVDIAKNTLTPVINTLTDRYYDTVREAWQQKTGKSFTSFTRRPHLTWQRVLWVMEGGTNNTGRPGYTFGQVQRGQSRGITFDDLWQPINNTDDMEQMLGDWVSLGARLSMNSNITHDPTKPRWARVPHGSKTCAFCLMLSSRGFAYTSEEAAGGLGNLYHAHCQCTVTPSWGEQTLTGYDPDAYKRMWDEAKKSAGRNADYHKVLDKLRHMYPDQLKDGIYTLSKPWPKNVYHVTDRVWQHIIDGDPNGKGGHAPWATNPGKTHFPADWTRNKIKYSVNETIVNPDKVKQPRPDKRILRKLLDGVVTHVEMTKRKNGWRINTAYPEAKNMRGVKS